MGVFVVHYRFALILHDAIKAEYVDPDFVLLLQMLYTYFGRSPRRKLALRQVVKAHNGVYSLCPPRLFSCAPHIFSLAGFIRTLF